jgi:hypothetical protein
MQNQKPLVATAFVALLMGSTALCWSALNTWHDEQIIEAQVEATLDVRSDADDLRQRIADLERQAEAASELGFNQTSVEWIEAIAAAMDTPCPTEDSDNCYWLGGENMLGNSYLSVQGNLFALPPELIPQPAVAPVTVTEYVEVEVPVETVREVPVEVIREVPTVDQAALDKAYADGLAQGLTDGTIEADNWWCETQIVEPEANEFCTVYLEGLGE